MQQGRGIQEMSQYHSSMFSDAVYLFGTTFTPAPYFAKEELPDGRIVNQVELAEQVVLAAFAYLYKEKLIDIVNGYRYHLFFIQKKTAKVKKLQSTPPDISGLEFVILSSIRDNSDIFGLTRGLIHQDSGSPSGEVLKIVKNNLLGRGILKRVEKGKILFIKTHKFVVNGDISVFDISKEEKQMAELKKTLEVLQSNGVLYQQMLSDIHDGILSRSD
jgi:hypothetical protein